MQALVILYCLQNNDRKSQAYMLSIDLFLAWEIGGGVLSLLFLDLQMVELWMGNQCAFVVFLVLGPQYLTNNLKERDLTWFMVSGCSVCPGGESLCFSGGKICQRMSTEW